eukprot:TRINITY_DN8719_c0_g1_i1.p2 TRINITY_DN8719_c0_g1~~TRINITY_DN8719_c0_g1_i1.p2  ORF type:complete len:134 (+),score=44.05 TRINITY_DN8719_c0_g1_i1:26-427(+)
MAVRKILDISQERLAKYLEFEEAFVLFLQQNDFEAYRATTHHITESFKGFASQISQQRQTDMDEDVLDLMSQLEQLEQQKLQLVAADQLARKEAFQAEDGTCTPEIPRPAASIARINQQIFDLQRDLRLELDD